MLVIYTCIKNNQITKKNCIKNKIKNKNQQRHLIFAVNVKNDINIFILHGTAIYNNTPTRNNAFNHYNHSNCMYNSQINRISIQKKFQKRIMDSHCSTFDIFIRNFY